MKMAYIAIEPSTGLCFAICSADAEHIEVIAQTIRQWKKEGAEIRLIPAEEAKERLRNSVKPKPKRSFQ